MQHAVCPIRPSTNAARDHPTVNLAFRIAGAHGGKHLKVSIIQDVCAFLEECNFPWRLDPSDLIHHRHAVHHLEVWQEILNLFPMCRAYVVLLETYALAVQALVLDYLAETTVGRLSIGIIGLDALNPRIA